jgi:hypothetical protein
MRKVNKRQVKFYYGIYYGTKEKGLQAKSVSPCNVWLPSADSNHGQGG